MKINHTLLENIEMGDFVIVKIVEAGLKTLFGVPIYKSTME